MYEIGYYQVFEKVTYSWFNRIVALQFMEVNGLLSSRIRVLSSTDKDSVEPEMMAHALSLDLDIDYAYVYHLKLTNQTDELFND